MKGVSKRERGGGGGSDEEKEEFFLNCHMNYSLTTLFFFLMYNVKNENVTILSRK